jgi:predicted RecB family nuclease
LAEVVRNPPDLGGALSSRVRFIVGATLQEGKLCSRPMMLEHEHLKRGEGNSVSYAPILFLNNEKVTKHDRLLLAFQALVISLVQGMMPEVGKIIHGSAFNVIRVKLAPLIEEVQRLVAQIEADSLEKAPPTLTLNRHCPACPFRQECLQAAEQTDDLSLLRSLSEKEITALRSRGVTTLTQFSHTYRPGRRGKRRAERARKHDPALQALAMREKKVYVMDPPEMVAPKVALYLDVEGVPDRDFDYLLGLLIVEQRKSTFHSFWADDAAGESAAWGACLGVIEGFPEYALYHYGEYEKRFLERMKERGGEEAGGAIDRLLARTCNVLSAVYSHVYFPTRSNGLKDVAGVLGFRWSVAGVSGLQALAWRLHWESGKEDSLKEQLLLYNREDCAALKRVTEFLLSVGAGTPTDSGKGQPSVAQADEILRPGTFRLGKSKFFCPELEQINKCAYSDYQREKIYVRTSPAVRRSLKRKLRQGKKKLKVNEEVMCPPPEKCPECGGNRIYECRSKSSSKVVPDLKFTPSGVKRWMVRYTSLRYQCAACSASFNADKHRVVGRRVGHNLSVWAVYQHVVLRQPHEAVTQSLHDFFGLSLASTLLARLKPRLAAMYRPTYEKLKEKLRHGPLVHADETKGQVVRQSGYVWAFTNLEEVVYVYTPTRDGGILDEVLKGFGGVLVSDFYSAYDGVKCPQQKCLIHLMRDINDDLFHHPFDEELKQLAQRFVAVLKPIIDTIDAHGLKRHFLHKHKKAADTFLSDVAGQELKSEVAQHYQKRLGKYQGKLFTFLDHDGIPWNNNNAEVAIKRFASRRRMMGASFAEKGLQDYLIFLSLYQTCRNKHVSFLRFLRSGMLDLDAFVEGRGN